MLLFFTDQTHRPSLQRGFSIEHVTVEMIQVFTLYYGISATEYSSAVYMVYTQLCIHYITLCRQYESTTSGNQCVAELMRLEKFKVFELKCY